MPFTPLPTSRYLSKGLAGVHFFSGSWSAATAFTVAAARTGKQILLLGYIFSSSNGVAASIVIVSGASTYIVRDIELPANRPIVSFNPRGIAVGVLGDQLRASGSTGSGSITIMYTYV